MKSKRFVLAGTGIRAREFVRALVLQYSDSSQLVGLCDSSPTRMAYMNKTLVEQWKAAAVPVATPDAFESLIRTQGANAAIVTTIDGTHHEFIARALRCGCDVVTEKPMTIDAPKCQMLLDEATRVPGQLRVAFNYRWHPHRTEIRRLLMSETIGAVKSVNLEYLLDTDHGADYFRRWHARMDQSGGLLVHKATHHFDLVNWWLDAVPETVFAMGRLAFYGRDNALARGDGGLTSYPRYTDANCASDPFRFSLRDGGVFEGLYLNAESESGYLRDRNVFRDDINIYDQMSVLVRYRTGQQLVYSLVCYSPREGMRVTFNGDRGRIEYYEFLRAPVNGRNMPIPVAPSDRPEHYIRVFPHFGADYTVPVAVQPGGHGGADPLIMEQIFSSSPQPDAFGRSAGVEQGAASVLVGIAGNESIRTGMPVAINSLVELRPSAQKLSELR